MVKIPLNNFCSLPSTSTYWLFKNLTRACAVVSFIFSPLLSKSDMKLTTRSEEHTSELQSRENLVCRLPLEQKNTPSLAVSTLCAEILSATYRPYKRVS